MKLKLPHKSYELDFSLDIEERLNVVNEILNDTITLQDEKMTVEEYFRETWNVHSHKDTTSIYKEILGYYLTKENKDLSILSRDKIKEMNRGSARHTTFSSMKYTDQVGYGVIDPDDYSY